MNIVTISGATSKGNQPKFEDDSREFFYKEDYMGYESISEALVSEFLHYVDGADFIDYTLEVLNRNGKSIPCCKSRIYVKEGESFISLYKLLHKYDMLRGLKRLNGMEAVEYVLKCVYNATGIDIRNYLSFMLALDAIILNEDRHFNNISFIKKGGSYRMAPIFDNGLSLLSDTNCYPMDVSIPRLIRKVKARPFNVSFKKQVRYLGNDKTLVVDFDSFSKRLDDIVFHRDIVIPFKVREFLRAKTVLLKRLKETEGELWIRK